MELAELIAILAGWLTTEIGLLDAVIADLLGSYRPYHAVRALPGITEALDRSLW